MTTAPQDKVKLGFHKVIKHTKDLNQNSIATIFSKYYGGNKVGGGSKQPLFKKFLEYLKDHKGDDEVVKFQQKFGSELKKLESPKEPQNKKSKGVVDSSVDSSDDSSVVEEVYQEEEEEENEEEEETEEEEEEEENEEEEDEEEEGGVTLAEAVRQGEQVAPEHIGTLDMAGAVGDFAADELDAEERINDLESQVAELKRQLKEAQKDKREAKSNMKKVTDLAKKRVVAVINEAKESAKKRTKPEWSFEWANDNLSVDQWNFLLKQKVLEDGSAKILKKNFKLGTKGSQLFPTDSSNSNSSAFYSMVEFGIFKQ